MYLIKLFLKHFHTVLFMFILSSLTVPAQSSMMDEKIKTTGNDPGYSIFHETLVDLSWPEVKKASEENALVIIPVGVIEQHGPHLSLGPDTYIAYHNSVTLKQSLKAVGINAVVAPPVYWGIMQLNESGAFPGSFTVSPETMRLLLTDIFEDLHRWGFRYVFCLNHHGDRLHRRTLSEAIENAKQKFGLIFYNDQERKDLDNCPDLSQYIKEKLYDPNYHAGTTETSEMLTFYPDQVNVEILKDLKPENTWQPLGYVGDPANYANVNAAAIFKAENDYLTNCVADWLKKIKTSSGK